MSLSEHVRILGRGPGRSRSLTQTEAYDAMQLMLADGTSPEAVGALLMLLRMKGETADEIAGLASSAQVGNGALAHVDLDWPSYAAGRTRGAAWFLLSAKLVAQAGHRVLLHGWNGADTKVRAGLFQAGIGSATDLEDAARLLDRDGIAYLPLEKVYPALFRLLNLREVLGLRSCVNTVCRMLNPGAASASVQGVFHPSYRLLQADAAALLGWKNLSVIKGGGGEFERHPSKEIAAFGLREGVAWEGVVPATTQDPRRLSSTQDASLLAAWEHTEVGAFEVEIVVGTAALALDTLGVRDSRSAALAQWDARRPAKVA
ncbi:MAG: glycosyl transferase family protein [Litoreibacter sp.]|uniref:glycosyl transferase family protein n=1 Tax=Litoreibacter sp. TaxID=1969459 RepID=UPI003299EBDF